MAFQKSQVTNLGRGRNLSGFEYCHQYSTQPGEVPSSLDVRPGEMAVNVADGIIYVGTGYSPPFAVKVVPSGYTGTVTVRSDSDEPLDMTYVNGILISALT